jgi:predicted adenine nucleotide alpha hydrolase (AANH) superfamily ATPase
MPRQLSEERTRKEMKVPLFFGGIDPQYERADSYFRDHSKVKTVPESAERIINCRDIKWRNGFSEAK